MSVIIPIFINEIEIDNSQLMAQHSKQVIVLCDSTKVGKDAYVKMLDLDHVSMLITDNKVDRQYVERLHKAGLHVEIST